MLEGYSLPSLEVSTSTQLSLRLYWQVTANPPYPYVLGIGLRGADGILVWNASGQTVSWTRGRLTTEHYLQFPYQVGGGDYDLEVRLYDPIRGFETGIVRIATLHLTQEHLSSPQNLAPLVSPFATAIFTPTVKP